MGAYARIGIVSAPIVGAYARIGIVSARIMGIYARIGIVSARIVEAYARIGIVSARNNATSPAPVTNKKKRIGILPIRSYLLTLSNKFHHMIFLFAAADDGKFII
ncbi:hypothetical protein [Ureibacillus thermophilus]|uniref:Uncharacterized protein n=1 Tax=Ureibacillus thermophilus TaxID=367743 RepID=A0A4P6UXT4_9BACL|nr:hypothetical protein [Ureibacillus thermophilus]QBK26542.1 hypothetical protein DKZ56_12110 [Ureibacillus thermophilus]